MQVADLNQAELSARRERPEAALGEETRDDTRRALALALERRLRLGLHATCNSNTRWGEFSISDEADGGGSFTRRALGNRAAQAILDPLAREVVWDSDDERTVSIRPSRYRRPEPEVERRLRKLRAEPARNRLPNGPGRLLNGDQATLARRPDRAGAL